MMRPESFTYHASKAKQLLDVVGKFYAEEKYTLAQTTIIQIQDLLTICLTQMITVEFMQDAFPDLKFEYDPIKNYNTVSNQQYELTRDQAIHVRNQLLVYGFKLFQVSYEGNGIVDWDTKDEPDYLVELVGNFGTNWRIKRSENDPYKFFFTSREVSMNQQGAIDLGTIVKRRYPSLTVVVYYNDEEGRKSVTINTWATTPGEGNGSNEL